MKHQQVVLSLREANLLRRRIRALIKLQEVLLSGEDGEAVHDLRVASRRLRELLDAVQDSLPQEWYKRLKKQTRSVTEDLSGVREAEVNLKLLHWIIQKSIVELSITEVLNHSLKRRVVKRRKRIEKKMSRKGQQKFISFLDLLHGSRIASPFSSQFLHTRVEDFLSFSWHGEMDDDQLHDLRLRTKKLRYALEIEQALSSRPLGRFLRTIRGLQEVLGQFHDLSVFLLAIEKELKAWDTDEATVIPAGLVRIVEFVRNEKHLLYPRIYPLYAKIIAAAPPDLPLIHSPVAP